MRNKYLSLFIILAITFLASGIGGFITNTYKEPWYSGILSPSISPPDWVFAPVWSTLYFMMALAAWLAWINNFKKDLLLIYYTHLIFNALWSVIFFGLHEILFALIDLGIIVLFIIYLMKRYFQTFKTSFYLMVPYFCWSCYAFLLNFLIYKIN